MKFLTSDTLVVGASALIISSLSIFLYADFNRKLDAGTAKQIGTITFKKQMAQRKYLSQVVWEDVEQDYPVFNNDSIRTSTDSEAVIHLQDGTDINIDENSMIMLSTLENQININFDHGAISANRSNVEGLDIAEINIKSQDTTVTIDKSNIELTQMENQELDLNVSDGSATVKSGDDQTIVQKNEKAIINEDKNETRIVKLNFNLKEPAPNQYLLLDTSIGEVFFSWDVTGNVKDYTFQISRDRKFKNIFITRKTGNNRQQKENLESGTYYWRVSAVNADNGQTEFSDIRKINVMTKKPPRLVAPLQNELVSQTSMENSVTFKWNDEEKTNDYIIEISQDSEFKNIITSQKTKLRTLVIENLGQGEYFWRVKSNIVIGSDSFTKISQVFSFRVEKGRMLNPCILVTPVQDDKIDVNSIKTKGIIFSWKAEPGYIGYEIDIARNEAFTDMVTSQKRSNNYFELKDKNQTGRYYWRIKGIMNNAGEKTTSTTGTYELVIKENIVLTYPSDGAEIKIKADDKKSDVNFTWNPVSYDGKYKVQVSRNRDFTDSSTADSVKNNSSMMSLGEQGEYYWRVLLLDDKGRELLRSNPSKFIILKEEKKIENSYVHVKSPVAGSRIFINSKYRGLKDVKQDVKPGEKIKIRVVTKDFEDYNTTVTVKEGETLVVTPELQKKKKLERIKWANTLNSPVVSVPVYAKDRIITCSENGTVTILSINGEVIFSKKLGKRFDSKAVVYGDNAYLIDVNGILFSLDIVKGKVNWQSETGGPMLFKTGPVVVKDRIYVATGYGLISAFDLSGKKIWDNNLEEAVYNSLLVFKDTLIIATDALNLYSLDADDGDENWSIEIDDRVITLTPLFYGNKIFFGCYSGKFYAVEYKDGDIAWTFMTGGPIYSSPAINDKSIFFGSEDGYLYSLDYEKGSLNWKFKTGGPVSGSPLIALGNVYITDDRTLFAINPDNGLVQWQNTFDSKIRTSPSLVEDTIVLGLANGKVVSVRNTLIETIKK